MKNDKKKWKKEPHLSGIIPNEACRYPRGSQPQGFHRAIPNKEVI